MAMHIVLHEPQIPQNTGSIGRTCMALGARLHLIEPLGFEITNTRLKRAGLDYWHELSVEIHGSWEEFVSAHPNLPLWFFTTKAAQSYDKGTFEANAALVFGKETAGLPDRLIRENAQRSLRIPILPRARSLNLSVAVGVAAFEAARQNDFIHLAAEDPAHRLF